MLKLGSRMSGGRLSLVMLMVAVMLLAACNSPGPATGSLDGPRREPA
jgi:hypothetical protein